MKMPFLGKSELFIFIFKNKIKSGIFLFLKIDLMLTFKILKEINYTA